MSRIAEKIVAFESEYFFQMRYSSRTLQRYFEVFTDLIDGYHMSQLHEEYDQKQIKFDLPLFP